MAAAAPSPTAAVAERRALHKKSGGKAAGIVSMLRAACLRSGVSICQSVFMSSAITAFCLCICFVHVVLSFMHRVFPTYPERSVFPLCCLHRFFHASCLQRFMSSLLPPSCIMLQGGAAPAHTRASQQRGCGLAVPQRAILSGPGAARRGHFAVAASG